ncbi:hypothetical protein AcV7_005194 [Taiwanofungus camphoratus]|nr:hypothetical protein AcW2_005753 [Antrodia cinnamomea]KAI0929730.1 hypothetical protein AcV7_005194 [Antrodia cinnamomea]
MSSNKIWFITGSSSGFGRLMTEWALKNGDIVIATLRKPEVLADLSSQYPSDKLLVTTLDVSKPQGIIDAFAKARETFGRVDVVFNNAGYAVDGEAEGIPDDAARAMFEVNFWGAANVSREAVRFFRDVNKPVGGRLLQVSSVQGIHGNALLAYYGASKFALEGFSEALAAELDSDWNIHITIIEPGWFRTRGLENAVIVPPHPAYTKPSSVPAVARRALYNNSQYPGDADTAVKVMYRLTLLSAPPLHFPLGKDCIAEVRRKTTSLLADTDRYESWSEGAKRDQ